MTTKISKDFREALAKRHGVDSPGAAGGEEAGGEGERTPCVRDADATAATDNEPSGALPTVSVPSDQHPLARVPSVDRTSDGEGLPPCSANAGVCLSEGDAGPTAPGAGEPTSGSYCTLY